MLFCPNCEQETLNLWTDDKGQWVGECVSCGRKWKQDGDTSIQLSALEDYSSVFFDDEYDSSDDDNLDYTTAWYDHGFEDGYQRAFEDAQIVRRLRRWWIARTWRYKSALRPFLGRLRALFGHPYDDLDDIPF